MLRWKAKIILYAMACFILGEQRKENPIKKDTFSAFSVLFVLASLSSHGDKHRRMLDGFYVFGIMVLSSFFRSARCRIDR